MKVLFAVPYIYDKRYPEFTKNPTGFGILMTQIYEHVAKNSDAYLISHVLTKGHGNILRHTLGSVIRHMHWRDLMQGIRWALKYNQPLSGRLRYLYYCINKGYVRHTIQQLQPDIVHINAVGLRNKTYIEACKELGVKYVITLHGLIGLDDSVKTPIWNKKHEKEVLLECEKQNVPVTVISTGIKERIVKFYLKGLSRCITVVPNGTNVERNKDIPETNLRRTYHIPTDAAIAVSIGSLCGRKNQIQTVEAISLICKHSNKDIYLFFCGRDCTGGAIQKRISELGLTDRIFVLGYVPYEQIGNMYAQADLNILASIDEGFGLGIIEAFVYGLPSVTFADLDAIPDIYDESAMLLCKDRSTEALADAILQAVNKDWNRNDIIAHSKKFSLEQMAKNYLQVYEKILRS